MSLHVLRDLSALPVESATSHGVSNNLKEMSSFHSMKILAGAMGIVF